MSSLRSLLAALAATLTAACAGPTQSAAPLHPHVPFADSPSGGAGFTFCPAPPPRAPLQLGNAAWLAFLSANEYAHARVLGPMLNALGFYNPGRPLDRAWSECLDDLRRLRRAEAEQRDAIAPDLAAGRAADVTRALLPERGPWGACARELLGRRAWPAGAMPSAVLQERLVHEPEPGAYLQFFSGRAAGKRWWKDGSTQVVFARHRELPVAVIAFRGTEPGQLSDMVVDLEGWKTKTTERGWPAGWGSVHTGFLDAFAEVEAQLLAKAQELEGTETRIWVTGHSLGAALATLTVARLLRAADEGSKVKIGGLYGFGSPRVGDREFADALRARAEKHGAALVRVRNGDDAVTAFPVERMGYVPVGTLVHLAEGQLTLPEGPEPPYASWALGDHGISGYRGGRPVSGYYRRLKQARESGAHAALDRCEVDGR